MCRSHLLSKHVWGGSCNFLLNNSFQIFLSIILIFICFNLNIILVIILLILVYFSLTILYVFLSPNLLALFSDVVLVRCFVMVYVVLLIRVMDLPLDSSMQLVLAHFSILALAIENDFRHSASWSHLAITVESDSLDVAHISNYESDVSMV